MNARIDNSTMAPWRGKEPDAVVLGELEVRPALPEEMERVKAALNDQHYLGCGRQVGRTLVQVVHHRGRWVAILIWGPAAMKLIDRDLILTLALSEHESGAPVAVTIASKEPKSEKSKTAGELTAAKRLYESVELQAAVVTGDALHCERENIQLVVENNGDVFFQLKGNATPPTSHGLIFSRSPQQTRHSPSTSCATMPSNDVALVQAIDHRGK